MPQKHTYKTIKQNIEFFDNKLLSTEYINSTTKLKIQCPNNHIFFIRYNNFQQGQRCSICAGNKKHTIEYIKECALKDNTICKSNKYINNREKLLFECPKGHEYEMRFDDFKKGSRCSKCYHSNNREENHYNWNEDRTRQLRIDYLRFRNHDKNILKDDSLYQDYIINREKYHVDHIYPRKAFIDNDLDNLYGKKIIKEICNSIDNLRIILKEENLNKNSKYNQEEFMIWFNKKLNKKEGN